MIRRIYAVCLLALAAYLASAIVVALGADSLFEAGPRLAREPWGWVTLVDLYLGFLVVGGVIVWRERRPSRWAPWLVGIFVLGNLTSAVYLARWMLSAGTDRR